MARYGEEPQFQFPAGEPRQARRRWLTGRWAAVLLLVVAGAGAAGYLYLHPEQAPQWLRATPLLPEPAPTVVYRWRDRQGAWHVTDSPPPGNLPYERTEYRHDTNVLPVPPAVQRRN